ncbi:hypothetical protein QQ045_015456 [Rhodiola kirilowii]
MSLQPDRTEPIRINVLKILFGDPDQQQHQPSSAESELDIDYLLKRKFHNSAKAFQQEGEVSTDPVAIDAPGGFLSEWWSVFWDIFIARSNQKHSKTAASYIEAAASYIVMQGCICFIYDFKLQIYHERCYLEEKASDD